MPRFIKKLPSGSFKVCEQANPSICYSNKGLTLKQAKKQAVAIQLSQLRKAGRIPKRK
jgi:hypothetical protein